ncbi:MAG: hypothetical protein ACYC49_10490 [Ignavibacteriaceae bacterium]
MKKVVYNMVVVVFAVLAITSTNFSEQKNNALNKQVIENALREFPNSLKTGVPGIIESTIYNIVLVKKYFPNEDYNNVIKALSKVAQSSDDPSLKFKAHLALIYLTYGSDIELKPIRDTYDHEYIFKQISEQLEKKLLVATN